MFIVISWSNKILASLTSKLDAEDYASMFENAEVKEVSYYPTDRVTVDYMGLVLDLPSYIKFLATDEDGTICGYLEMPELYEGDNGWYHANNKILAKANTTEFNWKESLLEVGAQ